MNNRFLDDLAKYFYQDRSLFPDIGAVLFGLFVGLAYAFRGLFHYVHSINKAD